MVKHVEIKEFYKNYNSSVIVTDIVRELINFLPKKYVNGLKTVVITNSNKISKRRASQKTWSKKKKVSIASALGVYHPKWREDSAWIALYTDNILEAWPPFLIKVKFFRFLMVSEVLYHEIGHHIHQNFKPEFGERETIADKWSKGITSTFMRKRFWYLMPLIYIFKLIWLGFKGCRALIARFSKWGRV